MEGKNSRDWQNVIQEQKENGSKVKDPLSSYQEILKQTSSQYNKIPQSVFDIKHIVNIPYLKQGENLFILLKKSKQDSSLTSFGGQVNDLTFIALSFEAARILILASDHLILDKNIQMNNGSELYKVNFEATECSQMWVSDSQFLSTVQKISLQPFITDSSTINYFYPLPENFEIQKMNQVIEKLNLDYCFQFIPLESINELSSKLDREINIQLIENYFGNFQYKKEVQYARKIAVLGCSPRKMEI